MVSWLHGMVVVLRYTWSMDDCEHLLAFSLLQHLVIASHDGTPVLYRMNEGLASVGGPHRVISTGYCVIKGRTIASTLSFVMIGEWS